MATNGMPAAFVAGGEFPFPMVQSGAGVGAVSIAFREFGIDKTQNFRTIDATFDEGGLYFRITPDNTTPAIDGILARQPDGVHRGYVLTNTSCGAVYLWWEATVR